MERASESLRQLLDVGEIGRELAFDHELDAAVARVRFLGRTGVDRTRAAVADGVELVLGETVLEELIARALRALLGEPLVVLIGAARIAVTFDRHVLPLG